MRIQSPLSNLRDVLVQVRDSAKTYQKTLAANEDATRAALVDPVLRALGWDIANPNMVEVEKTVSVAGTVAKADYALLRNDVSGKVQVVVEAKRLGDPLGPYALSLTKYAFAFQVTSLFLTDGIIWHHYDKFDPSNFTTTEKFNLFSDDPMKVAAYLVQELDAARFWPEEKDTTAPEILRLQQDYSALEKRILALEGGTPPPPPPAQNWVDFDKLPGLPGVTNTLPSQMRLPDGNVVNVRSWGHALVAACEYVLNADPMTSIPFSDSATGTVNLLSTIKPSTGRSHQIQTKSGATIFIYVNYSANGCVANINHIFSHIASRQLVKPAVVYASV